MSVINPVEEFNWSVSNLELTFSDTSHHHLCIFTDYIIFRDKPRRSSELHQGRFKRSFRIKPIKVSFLPNYASPFGVVAQNGLHVLTKLWH